MGQFAGEFVNPLRIAAALRKTAPIAELDVYHGTPHQFPGTEENPLGEFDASKIGTGEGVQAYGHGIYLAEDPDVAKTYQSAQSPSARKATMTLQASDGNVNKAIAAMKKEVATMTAHKDSPYLRQGAFQETQDALNYLQQMKKGAAPQTGALYTADLPDEMIDRMLDWDKPLSEQSPAIKKAMGSRYENWKNSTGQDLYETLSEGLGGDKVTSDWLRENNIPGIRYLDADKRLGGSGTRNFVVFPGEEKKVRILERDGQKAPPQKIAQALEAAPDYRMGHRPMTVEGGAARLDNAYEAFGEDIYGPNALRYFGGSDPRESGTVAALKRLRDNPDAEVTIYRGVPTDAKGGITKGDWVTLDKSVAQEFAELKPGQKGKVLAIKVKAKDVTTWPDSLLEFGYYPAD